MRHTKLESDPDPCPKEERLALLNRFRLNNYETNGRLVVSSFFNHWLQENMIVPLKTNISGIILWEIAFLLFMMKQNCRENINCTMTIFQILGFSWTITTPANIFLKYLVWRYQRNLDGNETLSTFTETVTEIQGAKKLNTSVQCSIEPIGSRPVQQKC